MNTKELIKMVSKNKRDSASATAIMGLGLYALDNEQQFYLWKIVLAYIEELEKNIENMDKIMGTV